MLSHIEYANTPHHKGSRTFSTKTICDAIKGDAVQHNWKTYLKDSITMSFPRWVMDDCIMTLAIDECKVGDFAKALFNAQVKSR